MLNVMFFFFFFSISWWFEIVNVFICIWIYWGCPLYPLMSRRPNWKGSHGKEILHVSRSPVDPYPGLGSDREKPMTWGHWICHPPQKNRGVSLFHPLAKTLWKEGLVNKAGFRPNNINSACLAGLPFLFLARSLHPMPFSEETGRTCQHNQRCVPLKNHTSWNHWFQKKMSKLSDLACNTLQRGQ